MQVPIKDTTQPPEVQAIFYQDDTLDAYTFVLEHTMGSTYWMLSTSDTGDSFSQFSTGTYYPNSNNEHLGQPAAWDELNGILKDHIKSRLEYEV